MSDPLTGAMDSIPVSGDFRKKYNVNAIMSLCLSKPPLFISVKAEAETNSAACWDVPSLFSILWCVTARQSVAETVVMINLELCLFLDYEMFSTVWFYLYACLMHVWYPKFVKSFLDSALWKLLEQMSHVWHFGVSAMFFRVDALSGMMQGVPAQLLTRPHRLL